MIPGVLHSARAARPLRPWGRLNTDGGAFPQWLRYRGGKSIGDRNNHGDRITNLDAAGEEKQAKEQARFATSRAGNATSEETQDVQ